MYTVDVLAQMMLDTLLGKAASVQKCNVPIETQIKYMQRHADNLSLDERRELAIMVQDNVTECAEGLIINLDNIPGHIIERMYNLVVYYIDTNI